MRNVLPTLITGVRILPARVAKRREFEGKALIRRTALITSMLILSACGFEPLHGRSYRETLTVDLSSITIDATGASVAGSESSITATSMMGGRYGELLEAEIYDQIQPDGGFHEKLFRMSIRFSETDSSLFVNPDGTASRGDLIYSSDYTITRIKDAKVVASGNVQRVSSYNTSPNADYASFVSIEDARKRGILELAQDYKLRLATLLPTLNTPDAVPVVAPAETEKMPVLQPVRGYETLRSGR